MPSDPPLAAQARALLAAGRAREARALLEKLAAPPADPWALRQLAEIELAEGDAEAALRRVEALDASVDDEAAFLRARADAALGRLEEARQALAELRARLRAPSAALELCAAFVEQRRGDAAAAVVALESAIAIDPAMAAAYERLAALHAESGDLEAAREALERGVAALPSDARLRMALARLQALLGRSAAALASAQAAEAAAPRDAATWREIGRLRAEYWRWEEAARALDEASRREPGDVETETLRAVAKQETGETDAALAALASAEARHPGSLRVAMGERLMLPQVYPDIASPARWRERYRAGLERLLEELSKWTPQAREAFRLDRTNFLLAYQGEDDRELQRRYSGLLAALAQAAHPEWRAPRERSFDGGRRLRVGFVSGIFRECTAGRYFERWVTDLDPRRFERFVYHTASVDDALTRRVAGAAEHFATLRASSEEVAARLATDALDVIVHPEVGMTPQSCILAALRLAPAQCAAWGHPVTTGSDAIDHYFTCAAMEPADAAAHYVETLAPLPGLGVRYAMPAVGAPLARRELGLPESRRLYICPQSLFKVHPEMDALLVRLVEEDPDGALVFFQAPVRRVTLQFAERLQRALESRGIPARGQLKFLPRMNEDGFRQALAMADVVVDTVRWSGGNTSLDALAAGTPVVTLPGRFMRGRQTAGMLSLMGLEELVAGSAEDYVRLAVETARDRDRNAALRQAIARNREALFERPEPVAALSEALLAIAAKA